jgi:energy-coupling factor transporter transmembrane protein EcfT
LVFEVSTDTLFAAPFEYSDRESRVDQINVLTIFCSVSYFISKIAALLVVLYLTGAFTSDSPRRTLYRLSGILGLVVLSGLLLSWIAVQSVIKARADSGQPFDRSAYVEYGRRVFGRITINIVFFTVYLTALLAVFVATVRRVKNVSCRRSHSGPANRH